MASRATVRSSKRLSNGISTPKLSRQRLMTWVASNEWPPSAKKSSWIPTSARPNTADQIAATRLLPRVRAMLTRCLDRGDELTATERAGLAKFAAHMRRHLVAENAILLPIARARLTRADLKLLTKRMRSRRGLPHGPEAADAD